MPTIRVSCFCTNTRGQDGCELWCVLPSCGHIFHQSCIKHWFAQHSKAKDKQCPTCRKPSTASIKADGSKTRIALQTVRLYYGEEHARSDPASQATQLWPSRYRDDGGNSTVKGKGKAEDLDDEIEESDEDVEGDAAAKDQRTILDLRRQLSEIRASLKSAQLMPPADMERLERAEEQIQHQSLQIAESAARIVQFELDQPELREEMQELEDSNFSLEVQLDECERAMRTLAIECRKLEMEGKKREAGWQHLKSGWDREREKFVKKISKEGTEGATLLAKLKEDTKKTLNGWEVSMRHQEQECEVYRVRLESIDTAHAAELARTRNDIAVMREMRDQAIDREHATMSKLQKAETGNESWRQKYDRVKDDMESLRGALKRTNRPSPLPSPVTTPSIQSRPRPRSPTTRLPFKLHDTGSGTTKSTKRNADLLCDLDSSDDDGFDVVGGPSRSDGKRARRSTSHNVDRDSHDTHPLLTTMVSDRISVSQFGQPKAAQSVLATDKYLPDYAKAKTVIGLGHKKMRVSKRVGHKSLDD